MRLPRKFIKATESYTEFHAHVPAPYLRKSFVTDFPTRGELVIAATGFYKLYVNGVEYKRSILAPYISNPDHYIYADKFEVDLPTGENVIAIWLGNGFKNNPGGYIWDFEKAAYRGAPSVALTLRDGMGTVILDSSDGFKTAPSPILFDDYRFGEIYDATKEIPGWNLPGFDDSAWCEAIPDIVKGEVRLTAARPILVEKELKPVAVWAEDEGYVYDFGESNAGVCRLTIQGKAGQRVEFQHADQLKDGKFYLNNVWFVRDFWERDKEIVHKDVYVCKGDGVESYTPSFVYHGFRYVKITGITPEQATPDLLTYVVFHTELHDRGGFISSDNMANTLQEITRRSCMSNFHHFPTDCPQREKNGWTADAALSTEYALINFDPEVNYREWLRNIVAAQDERGALPGIVPTGGWGFDWGNGPAWDCVLVYLPYFTYIYRGETDMITESADAFMKYLRYLTTRVDERGLMHIGLGDWCHAGRSTPKAPLELTDSIMCVDIATKMAFLFGVVGMTQEQAFAADLARKFREAIRRELLDRSTMTLVGDCQTSQAMGIYYGIFDEDEIPMAFAKLLERIHAEEDHLDVGVLGGRVIFHVLSMYGESELAFHMITRTDHPSYGNWVARGATTLWEDFHADTVSSMNHHFWGDISAWFIKRLAGIQFNPNGNDLNLVCIRPAFIDSLTHAKGWYDAPAGRIESAWEKLADGTIRLNLTIPESVTARVILDGASFPDGEGEKVLPSGQYIVK